MKNKSPKDIDDKINSLYQEAVSLKDTAIKSPENIQFYLQAAEKLHEVAELSRNLIKEPDIDKKVQYEALALYYFYEEQDCLSGFYYENRDLEKARHHREKSEKFIADAISKIKNIPNEVSSNIKEHLTKLLPSWEYHQKSDVVSKLGVEARAAWDRGLFIDALDIYRELAEFQEKMIQEFDASLEPKLKRITIGNFIGSMVNASSAMVLLIQESHKNDSNNATFEVSFDSLVRLLKYATDAYLFGESAFHHNPEWQQYREATQLCLENIKSTLLLNPDAWGKLYLAFEDNPKFLKIMKMTDPDRFNVAEGLTNLDNPQQLPVSRPIENSQTQEKNEDNAETESIGKADSIFEEIIVKHPLSEAFTKSREKETENRQDIEKIEDAIKLYGTTSPERKVLLKQTKERLETQLPQSLDEAIKTSWKDVFRWASSKTGIPINYIVVIVIGIFVVVFLIYVFANVLKVNDSLSKEQISFVNKATPTPTITQSPVPIQTSTVSKLDDIKLADVNANSPNDRKQEEVNIKKERSIKVIGGKVIISLNGIVFEDTIGKGFVHKATGTIGEVGAKKSIAFVKKESGYFTQFTVNKEVYEIRILRVDTFDADFIITNITK